MPDLTKPIEVSPSTGGIDASTAMIRYLVVAALTFAVGRGYISGDVESIAAMIVAIGTAAYGLYKTFKRGKQAVVLADAAPNSVANVK
jgi:hypothetical protein